MKMKVNQVLVDYDGKPIRNPDVDGIESDLTLDRVIVSALSLPKENQSAEEKVEFYRICQLVWKADEVDFTAEDIVKIKRAIGSSHFGPLVVGQVFKMLAV